MMQTSSIQISSTTSMTLKVGNRVDNLFTCNGHFNSPENFCRIEESLKTISRPTASVVDRDHSAHELDRCCLNGADELLQRSLHDSQQHRQACSFVGRLATLSSSSGEGEDAPML